MKRTARALLAVAGLMLLSMVLLGGCGGGSDGTTAADEWSLVALGDSIALTSAECDGCTSFVDLWADGLSKVADRPVEVSNQAIPGVEASGVLELIRNTVAIRSALEGADVIVIQLAINDTPWNRQDDPCNAAPEYPVIQWRKITRSCIDRVATEFEKTLTSILREIDELRAGKPTALRLTNVYNAVIGDTSDASWDSPAAIAPSKAANDRFASIQCRLVEEYGGACIDVYRAFNGDNGLRPAERLLASDYTHVNPRGHKLIAKLLLQSGFEPLR